MTSFCKQCFDMTMFMKNLFSNQGKCMKSISLSVLLSSIQISIYLPFRGTCPLILRLSCIHNLNYLLRFFLREYLFYASLCGLSEVHFSFKEMINEIKQLCVYFRKWPFTVIFACKFSENIKKISIPVRVLQLNHKAYHSMARRKVKFEGC